MVFRKVAIILFLTIVLLSSCSKNTEPDPVKSLSFQIPAIINKHTVGKAVVTQENVEFEIKILEEENNNLSGLLKITSSKNSKWRYVTGRYITPDSLVLHDSLAILDRHVKASVLDTTRLTGAIYSIKLNSNSLKGQLSIVPTRLDSIDKTLLPPKNTRFDGIYLEKGTLTEIEKDAWNLFNREKRMKAQFDSIETVHDTWLFEYFLLPDSVRQYMRTLAFEMLKVNVSFFEKWQHSPDSILVQNSFRDKIDMCLRLSQYNEDDLNEMQDYLMEIQPEGSRYHYSWFSEAKMHESVLLRSKYESQKRIEKSTGAESWEEMYNKFAAKRLAALLDIKPDKIHPLEKMGYFYDFAHWVVKYSLSYKDTLLAMLKEDEKSHADDPEYLFHIESLRDIVENYENLNRRLDNPAPNFIAKDMFGKTINLESYKGKVVYLDFWTTWCGPCLGSIPNLKKLYQKYNDSGFEIIGIAIDKADKVAKVCKSEKILWPQIIPSENNGADLQKIYGVVGYPEGFLLDKNGIIVEIIHPSDDQFDFILQQYLQQ